MCLFEWMLGDEWLCYFGYFMENCNINRVCKDLPSILNS
jgi:hypothetical protein